MTLNLLAGCQGKWLSGEADDKAHGPLVACWGPLQDPFWEAPVGEL